MNALFVTYILWTKALTIEEIKGTTSQELLSSPWHLSGDKVFSEKSTVIGSHILENMDTVELTYDLHGLCLLPGDASSIFFQEAENGQRHMISLSNYGKNCYDGEQKVSIPIKNFPGLISKTLLDSFHSTIWYPTTYTVDILHVTIYKNVLGASTRKRKVTKPTPIITKMPTAKPSPTIPVTLFVSPTITPLFTTPTHPSWSIQSVSSMKETKDRVCNQPSIDFIKQWVDSAKELGVNYISVETPYDNPSCGNAVAYTKTWIDIIRSRGLLVWHRSMPTAFEGIYNTPKDPNVDYIQLMANYIKANPSFYQPGDIFTPITEPQNGGIQGVTYCANNVCIFSNAASFNLWLRNAMTAANNAFNAIGLGGKIKVGYFGFDGFVAWGDNNPDWHGILEDATIQQMGNITIDHYPEAVGDTMQNDLNELQTKYPKVPIVIGEWGTITGGNVEQQVLASMAAAKRKNVIGFNYWHLGMGGYEALINDDFSHRTQYDEVQSFFKSTQ